MHGQLAPIYRATTLPPYLPSSTSSQMAKLCHLLTSQSALGEGQKEGNQQAYHPLRLQLSSMNTLFFLSLTITTTNCLFYFAMQCNVMQCHTSPCIAIQCNSMQCYTMPCHACHAMPCSVMHNAMQCHAMTCPAMQCHAMPCHALQRNTILCTMPRNVMQCNVMPCTAMQCHAISCHAMTYTAMQCHALQCAMPCNVLIEISLHSCAPLLLSNSDHYPKPHQLHLTTPLPAITMSSQYSLTLRMFLHCANRYYWYAAMPA